MNLREIWRRLTTRPYARALKEELAHAHTENALLRAENRALLNSILGIAGVPPIPIEHRSFAGMEQPAPSSQASHASADTSASAAARAATPTRRRSWQQINRMLEFESAKKKVPEAI